LKGINRLPRMDVRRVYDQFNEPVTAVDCGKMCAPHNPTGKPFCCDICQAVPAVYRQEWAFLRQNTDLWHAWRGDECEQESTDPERLRAETPRNMHLLACQGPAYCQREYRALSCRQFPFFPFITSDYRFIGLAYDWAFEPTCWVISNLGLVREEYRREFVQTFDQLFDLWPDELEGYALQSEQMRAQFVQKKRRIPILHRRGGYYLLSPRSERLYKVEGDALKRFGPY
jgi:hypothetical protein